MKKLAFIGDSLTEWFNWQKRFPEYQVLNLGIAGERVEELLSRLPDVYREVNNPSIIFLMTGINNIGSGMYDIIGTYRQIVTHLRAQYKPTKLVIQSILPVDLPLADNTEIRRINHQIEALANELGTEYLDIHRLFVDAKGNPKSGLLQDDGVHLSSKGYKVWADEVERFLKKH
jgi:lysophospholipase L1-like esterase